MRRAEPQVKPGARAWGVALPSRPGTDTGATEAPDYCFRIGGTRKFWVKAKSSWRWLENKKCPGVDKDRGV